GNATFTDEGDEARLNRRAVRLIASTHTRVGAFFVRGSCPHGVGAACCIFGQEGRLVVDAWIAMVMGLLIFAGSLLSVEAGISVALIEIVLGVVAGNLLSVHTTPWIDYLAG